MTVTQRSANGGLRKHDEIADSLTQDILIGQYRTGERLPSERDLAARFEANRGAVREAMKKLEQLGLATIQQGGARVAPIEDASLDVIGHLLAIGDLPDEQLVGQIMQVLASLITLAAESTVRRASDHELAAIRGRLAEMLDSVADHPSHTEARFAFMRAVMEASGNLVCRLIARALLMQFPPRVAPIEVRVAIDLDAYRAILLDLDAAFADRDEQAVRTALEALSRFNRDVARRAYAAIRTSHPAPRSRAAHS
jgi:GntR family transcriptional regulator, transcriptional repressor for pyruvate dehydrogenase complex